MSQERLDGMIVTILTLFLAVFVLGFFFGMLTGHVTVIRDDGTICAEIK